VLIVGCGGGGSDRSAQPLTAAEGPTAPEKESASGNTPQQKPRMVIRTGRLSIDADDYSSTVAKITQLVSSVNGFVSSVTTSNPRGEKSQGTMTLRIPSDKFDQVVADIKKISNRVLNESIQAEDITKQFYDLEARLQNKKLTEARLQEILQSAKNVQEIMAVEKELAEVRESIEQMQAEHNYMQNQVAYSTLEVTINSGQEAGFGNRLVQAIERGMSGFVDAIMGVTTFAIACIPVVAFLLLIYWLISRWTKRRKATAKTPT